MLRKRQNQPEKASPLLQEINSDHDDSEISSPQGSQLDHRSQDENYAQKPRNKNSENSDPESSEDENGIPKEHPFYKKTDEEIHQIKLQRLEIEIKKSQQEEKYLILLAGGLLVLTVIITFLASKLVSKINLNDLTTNNPIFQIILNFFSLFNFKSSKYKKFTCELWKKYSLPYTFSYSDYDRHINFCREYGDKYWGWIFWVMCGILGLVFYCP